MDTTPLAVAKDVFRTNKAFTLVTRGSGGIWAGKAYFGEEDGYIYVALEQGRNYRNVIENPEVFFVIERGVPDRFIQGYGIAECIGPIESRPEAHIIFRKALELVLYAKMIPGVMLFRIRPQKLFISDFSREWKPRMEVDVTEEVMAYFRTHRDRLPWWKLAWKAIRPFAFPATIAPVLVGTLAAPVIDWMKAVAVLIGTMLAHAGINVISDYMDWRKGADTWRVLGSSRVLVDGLMSPRSHLMIGVGLVVIAALIGALLVAVSGPAIWLLMGLGAAIGIFYTVPPIGLKYRALGDVAVFMAFGPLMALGAYYVHTATLDWLPVWLSVPIGLLTIAILHGNNYRDIAEDRQAGYTTVAGLLGAWIGVLLRCAPCGSICCCCSVCRDWVVTALGARRIPHSADGLAEHQGCIQSRTRCIQLLGLADRTIASAVFACAGCSNGAWTHSAAWLTCSSGRARPVYRL